MRRMLVIIFALLLSAGARAAPDVPEIAQRADAYRKSIEALQVTATAAQLLRSIKRADTERKTSDLIGLCEQLVALNPESFSSWLQLGNAHKKVDVKSDKALAAGYQAYAVTRAPSEQVEALLLISSVLRARLKEQSEEYRSARDDIEAANRWLRLMQEGEKSGEVVALDKTSPAGKWRLLNDTKDRASAAADVAGRQIEELTGELDAIYTEIATKLPGINVSKLKTDDARSVAFDLMPNSDSPPKQVTFRTTDGVMRACMEFTQELKSNNLSYRNEIAVWERKSDYGDDDKDKVAVTDFGAEASGRTLCLTNLKPGEKYTIQPSAKFESKQGATLKNQVSVKVNVPDLPQKVAFSGRSFLLPSSGDGEVSLRITNVPQFRAEIYRITDRTLHRHVALGHIGGALPKNEYDDLRNRFGEKLWSATIKIADDEKKRNKAFRAFLPVRAILNARKSDIKEKIRAGGASQGPISFWPQQNQVSNDGGRDVSLQDAKFEADVAAFEASRTKDPSPGVYALIIRDTDPKPDQDSDQECSEKCVGYFAQWFVDTDIGLTFYEGDSDFTVVARSLETGEAKEDARIELVSAGNRVLGSATNPDGIFKFSKSITAGTQSNKLVAILAETNTDFSFLTFGSERLDLSRLNVDGRPLTSGLSAFVTTERGIYQAGETIHALTMIRDGQGKIPAALPAIVLRLEARERTLDTKRVEPDQLKLGGADVVLRVPETARDGTARITVAAAGPDNAPIVGEGAMPIIGEAVIQLGAIRPDRARLDFVESSWTVRKSGPDTADLAGAVKARYLFGDEHSGAAGNLKTEILVKLLATDSPQGNCYQGFSFGLADDKTATVLTRQFFGTTDANGDLKLEQSRIPIPLGTRPVAAVVEVTVFDSSGPMASRSMTFPVLDDIGWIGLSKIPQLRSREDGRWKLNADLVLASSVADAQERTLEFKLQRESDDYVWEQRDGTWQYKKSPQTYAVISIERVVRLAGAGSGCAAVTTIQDIADSLDSGRFVLTVTDRRTNRQTSMRFQTGSVLTDPELLEPNIFSLSVNKPTYRPGETVEVTAKVPFDGPMLVAIADTDIRGWVPANASNGTATIKIPAAASWSGKQFYLLATSYRATKAGAPKVGPARAIGIASFSVEGNQSIYAVSIRPVANATDNTVQPREPLSFDICIADEPGGKCSDRAPDNAFAVAYVVDEGLLGLTSHYNSAPTPEAFFFGRKRLAVKIMDNYDRLLLKEGGDRPTRLALSNYTSTKVFSRAADCRGGKLERGTVRCTIDKVDLPSGAVSIYAAVWSPEYSVSAKKTVLVRSHVVAELGSPPFLFAGDSATLPLRLENIDFVHNGDFTVRVSSRGPVKRVSFVSTQNQPAPSPLETQTRLRLARGQPKTAYLNVETGSEVSADIQLRVSLEAVDSPTQLTATPVDWTIRLRPPALSTAETVAFALQRQPINLGEKLKPVIEKYDPAFPIDITVRFSDNPQLLLASAWSSVLHDPVLPILDQLVWRAMLLLRTDPGPEQKSQISKLISEIQSLQLPNGTFVPYRTIGDPSDAEMNVIDTHSDNAAGQRRVALARTATVLDLLAMASKAGIEVSGKAMTSASRSLKTAMDQMTGSDSSSCWFEIAYAARVLVAIGMADHDNLDLLKACKDDTENLVAKAASASTLQNFGLPDEAKLTLASFAEEKNPEFFEDISDFRRAMMLVFLKEAKAPRDLINALAQSLLTSSTRSSLSPAAAAWLVRAEPAADSASVLAASDFQLSGLTQLALRQGRNGVFETPPITYKSLLNSPISVGLKTDRNATAYITLEGVLAKPDEIRRIPEGALKRRFFNPETGQEIALDKASMEIGTRLVVVLEGTKQAIPSVFDADGTPISDGDGPLLVADLLPGAFEIISNTVELSGKKGGSALDALSSRGDLRKVYTDNGRWIGLVVPESEQSEKEVEEDSTAKEQTADGGKPAAAAEDEVEFRRAYLVRANLAGKFSLPPIYVERSVPPIKTFMSSRSSLQIKIPESFLK